MSFKLTDKVTWVGKIDDDIRRFHGEQLTTNRGTSYNAFLVRDQKSAIIDSVWRPFAKEFMTNLEKEIDPAKIDYVIVNHAEPDHSAALPLIMEANPNAPVYCTASGIKSIKGYYHKDWNFVPVKTGDKLNLGETDLIFVEASMLHWPDTMMTYMTGDNILFSNDVFGQHFASDLMFDDTVNREELFFEAIKYYANIVAPFSNKVIKKLTEFETLNLPLNMICPAHGLMWRGKGINEIIETYAKWANAYQENQITLIYDTMYESTRFMAEAIAKGIKSQDAKVNVKIYNSAKDDNSDIIAEVFRSKGVMVGCPTYNNGILNSTAAILEEIKGIAPLNKKAAAFGSYGWSPASTKIITEFLKESGFEIFDGSIKAQWNPTEDDLFKCEEFGSKFAASFDPNFTEDML